MCEIFCDDDLMDYYTVHQKSASEYIRRERPFQLKFSER